VYNQGKEKGITVHGCPTVGPHTYAKLYERFVLQNNPIWSSWNMYDMCKASKNIMTSKGIYQALVAFVHDIFTTFLVDADKCFIEHMFHQHIRAQLKFN